MDHHLALLDRRDASQPARAVRGDAAPLSGVRRRVRAGETLFVEGESDDALVIVRSGLARCCRMTSDGRRAISRFVWPGGIICYGAFAARHCTAETAADCELEYIARGNLESAIRSGRPVQTMLIDALAAELAERDRAQMRVTRMTADEALAEFLLDIAQRDRSGSLLHPIPMMRIDIADHLGVTLETVCRTLNRFHREGLIVLKDVHSFAVADPQRLRRLAAADEDAPPTRVTA